MPEPTPEAYATHELILEVHIRAPRERVWKALTEEISAWWPAAFLETGEARFRIEPRVGGRMFEDAGDGEGILWATVTVVRAPEILCLAGDLFPEYGGPGRSYSRYELSVDGDETILRFRDLTCGRLTPATCASLTKGWKFLFEGALKAWLEGRPAPAWED